MSTLSNRKNSEDVSRAMSPVIAQIISEYNDAHALDGLMALYQRLREVCGPDTTVQVNCADGESHLHATTYSTSCEDCD